MLRRRRVVPDGAAAADGSKGEQQRRTEQLKTPAVKALLDEYLNFPDNKEMGSCKLSIWRLVSCLMPPFLYRRRWIEFFLFCGPTLKSSVLEEFATHIVVEALLLTIIITPILDMSLEIDIWTHAVMYAMLYGSSLMSIICITVHILAVVAVVAVEDHLLLEYVSAKLDAFVIMGNLHTRSFFLFLGCIVTWPLLTIKGSDPYCVKWICAGLFVCVVLVPTLPWGMVGKINYILQPQIQILSAPNDKALRNRVEENVLLLSEGLELNWTPEEAKPAISSRPSSSSFPFIRAGPGADPRGGGTSSIYKLPVHHNGAEEGKADEGAVAGFLASIGMGEYTDSFAEQDIVDMDTLSALEIQDYVTLGVTIGDRIKLKRQLGIRSADVPQNF